jgi:diguanylate cyclase (GGDEF)-like protein
MDEIIGRVLFQFKGESGDRQGAEERVKKELEDFVASYVAIEAENRKQEIDKGLNPLTKVFNGRGAEKLFNLLVEREQTKPTEGEIVVVRLDLDNFKAVNDLAGHEAGDDVLKAVANKLRETDLLIHFSGDEFGLILSGVKHGQDEQGNEVTFDETIKKVLERVIEKIEEVNEDLVEKNELLRGVKITASVGYKKTTREDRKEGSFAKFDSQADGASAFAKSLKGTKLSAKERIISADENQAEIMERLGVSQGELAGSRFLAGVSRPVREAQKNLPPAVQDDINRRMEEIRRIIEENYQA